MQLKLNKILFSFLCLFISFGAISQFKGGSGDGYSAFKSICGYQPFPIELLSFDAYKEDHAVRTEWTTLSERNNDYFTIERSQNGEDWSLIGEVTGAGNSVIKNEYILYDSNPLNGLQYYRLKQTDFDGEFEYFDIKSVVFNTKESGAITVYPNPTGGFVTVSIAGEGLKNATLSVYSTLGKEVYECEDFNGNEYSLDLAHYESGVYILNITTEKEHKMVRIVKK